MTTEKLIGLMCQSEIQVVCLKINFIIIFCLLRVKKYIDNDKDNMLQLVKRFN